MQTAAAWPRKTREMHNHHMDSTRWNDVSFRDGDIVVATWGKSGTTWTQQIVCQLVHGGREDISPGDVAPWVDMRVVPWPETLDMLEAQTHRRVLKTHLPVDAMVISPKAKYLYVGRDARDVVWSMHNHHAAFKPEFLTFLNEVLPNPPAEPMRPADPDIRAYYRAFLDSDDGGGFWPFWENVQSWWDIRHLPNVMLLHFARMKADPEGEIRRIAEFLEIEVAPDVWPKVFEHSSFDYMRANADRDMPMISHVLNGGGQTFVNKGVNGRWRDVLSPEEIARCDAVAAKKLTPDCARWLATGEMDA